MRKCLSFNRLIERRTSLYRIGRVDPKHSWTELWIFQKKPFHLYSVSHGTVCFSAHWIFLSSFGFGQLLGLKSVKIIDWVTVFCFFFLLVWRINYCGRDKAEVVLRLGFPLSEFITFLWFINLVCNLSLVGDVTMMELTAWNVDKI